MMTRDSQGRQVLTIEETSDELGMTITNGADYSFCGRVYRATLEDQASDTLACFQRHPVNQIDAEPSMYLDREGTLSDDVGVCLGDYRDLEAL